MTGAFLRLYTAYQEEQLALADRDAETPRGGDGNARRTDAVAEARRFLTARRNSFPALDEAAAALAATVAEAGGFAPYIEARHEIKVRPPPHVFMVATKRRVDHTRATRLGNGKST